MIAMFKRTLLATLAVAGGIVAAQAQETTIKIGLVKSISTSVVQALLTASGRVRAEHVVFGHTHRAGPLPHDDPDEWRYAGARIVTAGSWVYEPFYLGPDAARSPYWPGTVVTVGEDGPPELRRLLLDRTLAELAGSAVAVTPPRRG